MHVLVVGGVKSFGVLFVELQQLYDVSAKQLGVVHGLASVLMMALGMSLKSDRTQNSLRAHSGTACHWHRHVAGCKHDTCYGRP